MKPRRYKSQRAQRRAAEAKRPRTHRQKALDLFDAGPLAFRVANGEALGDIARSAARGDPLADSFLTFAMGGLYKITDDTRCMCCNRRFGDAGMQLGAMQLGYPHDAKIIERAIVSPICSDCEQGPADELREKTLQGLRALAATVDCEAVELRPEHFISGTGTPQ